MDSVALLVQGAQDLTIMKHLIACAITLTLYDYFLAFDDEVRYIWRARKTWVSYFYILNRVLLTGYQFWYISAISYTRSSETVCINSFYAKVVLTTFFAFSSDVFVTLRVYAISFKNKILAVYFGTLVLARLVLTFTSTFTKPPVYVSFPSIPIDAFDLCGLNVDLHLMLVPSSIGTAFELSAFLVIIWYVYRNRGALRFSALFRTIVAEGTIYFLAIVSVQTYVQLSLILTKGFNQQISSTVYGLINPILTMRFVLSLRRSADTGGGRERRSAHFPSVSLTGGPSSNPRVSVIYDDIEMDPMDPLNDRLMTREP